MTMCDDFEIFATHQPGDVIFISTGRYSDYYVRGHFQLLKTINAAILNEARACCAKKVDYDDEPRYDPEAFIAWLIKEGYMEEFEVSELHVSDYYSEMNRWKEPE